MKKTFRRRYILFILLAWAGWACSHSFDSNVLDLNFYQWNLWPDHEISSAQGDPSCGWEDLHRGMGKLVRIPALVQDHFSKEEQAPAYWYHCRFTLPEDWEEKDVVLRFKGVGPSTVVFLNQEPIGTHAGSDGNFDIDVTGVIYYTRDNHLAVKIMHSDPEGGPGAGIAGTIEARVKTAH